ncbi:hypothetical protein DIZ27_14570 [Streptomyces sp. NWU339]|uniref:hypothetical protein n=1 Tax=Streptomyces sp. NWU339 TaxID=2185284 RepID=UPI000D67F9EC|nr:hypothetical protein [Streptomyces sp. NWU339]PWI09757.1 hypothetical protein DIZ27_14570 [Streptomyces sp. NWU339]
MTAKPKTESKIHTAPDGVQEVALSDSRPLLSRLIRDALGGKVSALTERGERRIMLVTPEWYDEAVKAMSERSA